MEPAPKLTPMMQQYWEVKKAIPVGALLMFRMGDFYEMFGEDAELGSRILGVTLTQRGGMAMAGVPYHAVDAYLARALGAGVKVAICDQMETPKPGQLVRRQLTRILTPGTTIEDNQLQASRNHFLLALDADKRGLHAAWLDLSTGEFQVSTETSPANLLPLLTALDPKELLLPAGSTERWATLPILAGFLPGWQAFAQGRSRTDLDPWRFEPSSGGQLVAKALNVHSLDGFGILPDHPALGPAGALIHYATETLCARPANLRTLREYRSSKALLLDPATLRNLEIFTSSSGSRIGTLIETVDGTATPAGARLLETWLAAPSLDLEELRGRHATIGAFLEAPGAVGELRELMRGVRDIPRILGRLQNRLRNPRELGGLRDTLRVIPDLRSVLTTFDHPAVSNLGGRLREFPELADLLTRALAEELPGKLEDGGYIGDGHDEELDRLRGLTRGNQAWLTELERSEQARTGIKNLKIKYSGAFGYAIEISKSNLHNVPPEYIRRQTLVNAERFITEDLKKKETEILHADERALAREQTLFQELVSTVLLDAAPLAEAARVLAEIDVLAGWANLARLNHWCRPEVDDSDELIIEEGRHPVVEQRLRKDAHGLAGSTSFVPNDTTLVASDEQIALITGPNMAGKSTYIRQVALIVILAQTGCWVPAKRLKLGLVDRVFSRVGASDELARGNSTFMVEMNETANILHHATARSLVILDEIGRGTSTYDGLSIAWAVVEHLHGSGASGARTLFATHYHELTQLEKRLPRVRNHCVAVKEWNDEIIFVRQVIRGAADRSYGIHVARLAGLPDSVVERAKVILAKLEADDSSHNLLRLALRRGKGSGEIPESPQLSLF